MNIISPHQRQQQDPQSQHQDPQHQDPQHQDPQHQDPQHQDPQQHQQQQENQPRTMKRVHFAEMVTIIEYTAPPKKQTILNRCFELLGNYFKIK